VADAFGSGDCLAQAGLASDIALDKRNAQGMQGGGALTVAHEGGDIVPISV